MAAPGTPFESPGACPFVALELDRDRRSDKPDYRHRCFAEPTPAPRSIAHQEAYCLSPNFPACPVFQDWAVRAAARPTPGPQVAGAAGAAGAGAALGAAASDDNPPDSTALAASAAAGAAAAFGANAWDDESDSEQLSVFEAGSASVAPATDAADEPRSSFGEPDAGYQEPPSSPSLPDADEDEPDAADAAAAAAVPAFLAGRAARPPSQPSPPPTYPTAGAAAYTQTASAPPPHPTEPVKRQEIVPSWEIDGRYGAEAAAAPPGSRIDGVLTALAVIGILGLGVLGVIFLPGLLAGGGAPAKTPVPSFAIPSVAATVAPPPASSVPSAAPSTAATAAPATSTPAATAESSFSPEPAASPRLYRIKAGDSLMKIAKRFGVTVPAILAANPQIQDANHIEVGQVIVIPAAEPPPSTVP